MRMISLIVMLAFLAPTTACGKDEDKKSAKGDDDDDKADKKKKKKRDSDSDCEAIYEKETECKPKRASRRKRDKDKDKDDDDDSGKPDLDKDEFMAACKMMLASNKSRKALEDEIECAHEDSCKDYEKCKAGAQGKKRAGRITQDLEDGKVKEAFSSCSWSPESFSDDAFRDACKQVFAAVEKVKDPEELRRMQYSCTGASYEKLVKAYPDFSKTCQKLASASYEKLMAKVIESRDAGKRDYSSCHTLEEAAKTIDGGTPGDTVKKAKAACAEMNAAENVTRGLATVKDYVARKRPMMPYQCSATVDELAKIDSDWAKKQKDELLKSCYVELGKMILETEGKKDMKFYCPYAIKELITASEKYDLATSQPDFAAELKKLPPICFKKR